MAGKKLDKGYVVNKPESKMEYTNIKMEIKCEKEDEDDRYNITKVKVELPDENLVKIEKEDSNWFLCVHDQLDCPCAKDSCDKVNKKENEEPKLIETQSSIMRHIFDLPDHITVVKPYSCNTCNLQFVSKVLLKKHKRFSCKINKISKTKKSLVREQKDIIGNSFSCDVCGRTFRGIFRLTEHKRSHTGERPYSCKFCEKTFPSNRNLRRHKKGHNKYFKLSLTRRPLE